MIVRLEPVDPFDHSRLWGDEKYKLCNMLIRQARMPASARAEFLASIYTDRVPYDALDRAYDQVIKTSQCKVPMGGDSCNWFRECSTDDFLAYAQLISDACHGSPQTLLDDLSAAVDPSKPRVRGARMVRFTNVSSGYPVYRWDLYYENDGPHDNCSAPVTYKQERYHPLSGWLWPTHPMFDDSFREM